MSKTRVCHLTTAHHALDSRIFFREAKSLARAGFEVHVVGIHEKKETVGGINIIPLKPSSNRLLRMVVKPLQALHLSIKTGSQIFHFHDPELIAAGLLLRLMGKKVIYDAHEDYPELIKVKDWISSPVKRLLSQTTAVSEKLASSFFSLTVAPTEPLSRRLPKGVTLYNFPTLEILNLLKKHGKADSQRDIDVIHLGVLRKVRLDFFIEVLSAIKNENGQVKSAFVGLTEEQIDYMKDKLGDSNNTLLLRKLPFLEVVKLLGRSRIGLNYHPLEPHLKFAVPVKVFEYLGAGCVVVSADFPFLRSLMGDDSPVLFASHSPDEFAKAVLRLMKNHENIREMSKISQEFSLRFSWEGSEEEKLIEAYDGLR